MRNIGCWWRTLDVGVGVGAEAAVGVEAGAAAAAAAEVGGPTETRLGADARAGARA